jgi:protein-S-isoprenylcysteine O-methyltransferase Ste14
VRVRLYALAAYIFVMLIGRFISQGQRKARLSLPSQYRAILKDRTALLAAFSAALALALPVLEATLREIYASNVYTILAGTTIILGGYGITYIANREISENWSPAIDKIQEQDLVTSGVYSVIRHPLYFSGFLIIVGSNVYFASSWAWVSLPLVLIVVLIRVPIEERRLVERFGRDYIAYQKRSKAILPWIL